MTVRFLIIARHVNIYMLRAGLSRSEIVPGFEVNENDAGTVQASYTAG